MKKTDKVAFALYCLCMVTCVAAFIMDIVRKTYLTNTTKFGLDLLCAVLWIIIVIITVKRNRSDKSD